MNLNRCNESPMGGRMGTATATRETLSLVLGAPSWRGNIDDKVTIRWFYQTPRGPAEIRDYWWNGPEEWSIAAATRKAALWLARDLRRSGIQATTRRVRPCA